MKEKYKVLFVCTGNICRSPTAEGVFRKIAENKGMQDIIEVDSAGTHSYHVGEPPDGRSIKTGLERGYDLRPLRARSVCVEDFERFDLVVALDRGHRRSLRKLAPKQHKEKIILLLEDTGHKTETSVPDPYYGTMKDFEYVLDLVEDASEKLLRKIQQEVVLEATPDTGD